MLPQLGLLQDWLRAEWSTTHLVEVGLNGEETDRGTVRAARYVQEAGLDIRGARE